ncbi:chloramphenicol phosphotransferase [Phyllobacterium sp. YR531]|uniref:chloramphenicol phosphotransferase CPT family protein n=1 Tax=Phyllobacterium sp. YR531 TaxID=1144343 RepID=UPI00026F49AA|nr:chloramphenicol phosphotransferase [Phyllobacterium sp. YR531]EJN03106.1 chloramphenicol 3-O-phosphotransferase [Phyllobacterium sp. YR531]
MVQAGQIIILNGAPRSGKSSIVKAIQESFDGIWMNLGVDNYSAITPEALRPGIGLRPGGERQDIEPIIPGMYAALYESIAAHSRLGFNVVADFGHHDAYAQPRHILADCAPRLLDLPVMFVGIHCPIEIIMERRNAGHPGREGLYAMGSANEEIPEPVARWQKEVHKSLIYDFEIDTSTASPAECAKRIGQALAEQGNRPSAFEKMSFSRAAS